MKWILIPAFWFLYWGICFKCMDRYAGMKDGVMEEDRLPELPFLKE